MNMFADLAAPFPADAVSWRAQQVTKDGSKAMALAYIDARDVMARLDEACGPANWQDAYHETAKGRLICTLSIRIDGEWIAKADGSGDSDIEGEKGALSGALKRAAVKWGIGRYLYDMPCPWVPCDSYERNGKWHWKSWTSDANRQLTSLASKAVAPRSAEQDGGVQALIDKINEAETELSLRRVWEANADYVRDCPDRARLEDAKDRRKGEIAAMNLLAA